MSLPVKLLSTDFDGTFFSEFQQPPVPWELIELIARLQRRGCKWIINTGRDMSSLMESLARAHVSILPDYLVLVEREIFVHDGVRYAPLEEWNSLCARDHEALFARVRPDVPALTGWVNDRFDATVYEDPFSPFCLIAGNNGDADQIHRHLDAYAAGIPDLTVVRNDVYARFSHAAYNKGTALTELARREDAAPEQVMAAGDHLNDLPMLRLERARMLIAPANSVPEVVSSVRQQGGFVSREKHGAGLARGIEHFLGPVPWD